MFSICTHYIPSSLSPSLPSVNNFCAPLWGKDHKDTALLVVENLLCPCLFIPAYYIIKGLMQGWCGDGEGMEIPQADYCYREG